MTEEDGRDALLDELARCAFTVTAVLSAAGARHDLSLTQVRVLGVLRDRRLRMAELADHLGLERSTMSGLVDRAEQRGLLARRRSDVDGRAVEVVLTDRGQALTASAYAEVAAALHPAVDRLVAADRDRLTALLERLLGPVPDPDVRAG